MQAVKKENNYLLNKKEEIKEQIKEQIQIIDNIIKQLELNGYDTKEVVEVYNTVKENILSSDNFDLLCKNGNIDDLKKSISTCADLLSDFVNQMNDIKIKKETVEEEYEDNKESYETAKKDNKPKYRYYGVGNEIAKAIALLIAVGGVIGSVKLGQVLYGALATSPEATHYYYDTMGNKSITKNHRFNNTEYVKITEYLETDKAGFRVRRIYNLDPSLQVISGSQMLNDIDLSKIECSDEKIFYDEKVNEISTDYFRTYDTVKIDPTKIKKSDNLSPLGKFGSIFLGSVVAGTLIVVDLIIFGLFAEELDVNIFSYFHYLIYLIDYKHSLQVFRRKYKGNEKEIKKYDEMLNTFNKRVDLIIDEVCKKMTCGETVKDALSEYEKQLEIASKVRESEELQKFIAESKKKQQLIEKQIDKEANDLYQAISQLSSEDEYNKHLHSIKVSPDLLFIKVGDNHYRIRKSFKKILPLLDLSGINFKNVECNNLLCKDEYSKDEEYEPGIDFSITNAVIIPKEVFNRDLSYSTFGKHNINNDDIKNWYDHDGVIIKDAILEEPLPSVEITDVSEGPKRTRNKGHNTGSME